MEFSKNLDIERQDHVEKMSLHKIFKKVFVF